MTTADFHRCGACPTTDSCGMVGRCLHRDVAPPQPYAALRAILDEAFEQSASGKGAERHANGQPWDEQPINTIAATVGVGFPAGQAIKKLSEAVGMLRRGQSDAARREVLGAIVYAAAMVRHIDGGGQ